MAPHHRELRMMPATELEPRIAIVTPSFARDFKLCSELNESVLTYLPSSTKHYLIVDGKDLGLFRALEGSRTVVAAVEDVIPRGYFRLPAPKGWWFSATALVPAKGWLIQQIVKLAAAGILDEDVQVNVDSDVRFVRRVDPGLFVRDGKTRLYRKPGGVVAGMQHVKWHKNVCRLLDVSPDSLPMDDYVGNVISWDPKLVAAAIARVETVTHSPWDVAFTRARSVGEYLLYGLHIEKVLGREAAGVWLDERSWCHTYWGPEPLQPSMIEGFVNSMLRDDVAISVAGYTATDGELTQRTTKLILERVSS
jgi:hypothetical protein